MRGEWKLGFGEKFNPDRLLSFHKGSAFRLPGGVIHYQVAGPDGAIIQIEMIGPLSIEFIDPDKKWNFPHDD